MAWRATLTRDTPYSVLAWRAVCKRVGVELGEMEGRKACHEGLKPSLPLSHRWSLCHVGPQSDSKSSLQGSFHCFPLSLCDFLHI